MTDNTNPRRWSFPGEPRDCTAVHDRDGNLWVAPGRPGNNLWWKGRLGAGVGYEWHELLYKAGSLTAAEDGR